MPTRCEGVTFLGTSFCLWFGVSRSCKLVLARLGVLPFGLLPVGVLAVGVPFFLCGVDSTSILLCLALGVLAALRALTTNKTIVTTYQRWSPSTYNKILYGIIINKLFIIFFLVLNPNVGRTEPRSTNSHTDKNGLHVSTGKQFYKIISQSADTPLALNKNIQ